MSEPEANEVQREKSPGVEKGTAPPTDGSGDCKENVKSTAEGMSNVCKFLKSHPLDVVMFCSRICTIVLVITFLFGGSQTDMLRALIANAITSAVRLHQRINGTPLSASKEAFARLLVEDSCHYLFYSIIFLMFGSVSFSLTPIWMFASLHVNDFALKVLCMAKGPEATSSGLGAFLTAVRSQTTRVLKIAACAEIFLMPLILLSVLRGNMGILAPFAYYRFLTFRYVSKRNHYTRTAFFELRMYLEAFMASGCPRFIVAPLTMAINLVSKLAPTPLPSS